MLKVIFLDIGLVSSALNLSKEFLKTPLEFKLTNEGGISEQWVGQNLLANQPFYQSPKLYYWVRDERQGNAEVDYLLAHGANIVPVEVKSGRTGTLRSLHALAGLRGLKLAVRINNDFPSIVDVNYPLGEGRQASYQLLSIPFYLVGQLTRLLDSLD